MAGKASFANNEAGIRGQAPPQVPLDDGVTRYDQYLPLPAIDPTNGLGQHFYRAPSSPDRVAKHPVAFTVRPWDKLARYVMSGLHGEVARQANRFVVGTLTPFGGTNRAVVRPVPNAWDSGYWTVAGTES